jgi:hypothetical protein
MSLLYSFANAALSGKDTTRRINGGTDASVSTP